MTRALLLAACLVPALVATGALGYVAARNGPRDAGRRCERVLDGRVLRDAAGRHG